MKKLLETLELKDVPVCKMMEMEKAVEMLLKQDELCCRIMDETPLPGQGDALELIWKYRPMELDGEIPLSEKYELVNKAWRKHKDGMLPEIRQNMFRAVCMRSYRGKEDWDA